MGLKKTLNLEFEKTGIIQLQYIPSELSLSEQSRHNTVQTLNGKVSFISPPGTHNRDLRISAYFTALLPPEDFENRAAILAAQGITAALGAAQTLGGNRLISVLNSIKQTVALAKGVYDAASGVISPKPLVSLPVGDLAQAADKVAALIEAERMGDICYIGWDLDNDISPTQTPYILKGLQVRAERLTEEGQTTEFSVQMDFIEAGDAITLQ
jgi:hypothetical protein